MKTLDELLKSARNSSSLNVESSVLKAALEAHAEEVSKSLQIEVQSVFKLADSELRNAVAKLRTIREMEKTQKTLVDEIDKAYKFFGTKGNPLPLYKAIGRPYLGTTFCKKMGIDLPPLTDDAWKC